MNKRRFTGAEKKQIRELISNVCCNYDDGNCAMLSDEDDHVCPQRISKHLCCRWFYEAVLPLDLKLLEAFTEKKKQYDGVCKVCGKNIKKGSNRSKYCDDCKRIVLRQQKARYMSKIRDCSGKIET